MGEKKRPTHEIRLGRIRATIWQNQTADAEVWFNVTLSRLFKEDGQWRDSESFRRDDLPIVTKAVDMAYDWIWKRQDTPTENASR